MKKYFPLLVALLAPVALSAASFEGKVTMKLAGPRDAPPAMTFSLKDGFARIDMTTADGRSTGVIYDSAKQEITVLIPDQKMYMTQAMTKPLVASAMGEGAAGGKLEVTTSKEKILGYDCVKYVAQTNASTSEIWVTDQLGAFLGFGGDPNGGAPAQQGWSQALAGKGVFPLRVVTTAGGKETFRMEATAVEKTALPASTFAAPADFKNLSDMMRGMGMPGGMPGMPGGMRPPGGK